MPEFNRDCLACPRLASHLSRIRDMYPTYYAQPVPPFGDSKARLLVVGLAPGMHGANRTGRPFTGDHAGILLYETLHRHGFSNRPASISIRDGLTLKNCRITNAVKCLPPANKPSPAEIATCNLYLRSELAKLQTGSVLLALGIVAHDAVLQAFKLKRKEYRFTHGAHHRLPNRLHLLDSYHCSRYNTQTKRLTAEMFDRILCQVKQLLSH
ncbi:MAG TPA: uracil-DNA glycosylase [Candidatus Methylomirabilis sp.]|nr:uracil-DNA glycosylase [Candidatus Methylomirabilis sp.]